MIILAGPHALGFKVDGTPVPSTHLWREDVLLKTTKTLDVDISTVENIVTVPTCSHVNIWSSNYFHFVTECLPSALQIPYESYERFLIPTNSPQFIYQGLREVGVDISKVVEWRGILTGFRSFIEPIQVRRKGASSLHVLLDLIALVRHPSDKAQPERLYVSRGDTKKRCLVDESIIPEEFVKVLPERMSFKEQVKLFSNAKEIIAPHGAGLTNMLWAPKGCRVIELFDNSYHNGCFRDLAITLGHQYVSRRTKLV